MRLAEALMDSAIESAECVSNGRKIVVARDEEGCYEISFQGMRRRTAHTTSAGQCEDIIKSRTTAYDQMQWKPKKG